MKIAMRIVLGMAVLASPVWAQDDAGMARANETGLNSLVVIKWKLDMGFDESDFQSMGVCVRVDDDGGAVVMLRGMDPFAQGEAFSSIRVFRAGSDTPLEATFMGVDPMTGQGFVRVEAGHGLAAVSFASTSNLAVGDKLVSVGLLPRAIGGQPYVGRAYVSTMIRKPETTYMVSGGSLTGSGSLVFDNENNLVGMVSEQLYRSHQMIIQGQTANVSLRNNLWTDSFLPVEEFADVLSRIPETPDDVRPMPWLGVLSQEGVSEGEWVSYGMDTPGVRIGRVIAGYAADQASMEEGDIIVALDGQPLEKLATSDLSARQFIRALYRYDVGDRVVVTYIRGGERRDVTLTLTVWPKRAEQAPKHFDQGLGMILREKVEMDSYVIRDGSQNTPGVVILLVAPNSPAARSGLQPSDVIMKVSGQAVTTVDEYVDAMASALNGRTTATDVLVRRGEDEETITVRTDW